MSDHPPPAGGYISPTVPNPNGPNDASIIIYGYIPSTPLAILALALYALLIPLHAYLLYRYRTRSFGALLLLTAVCELVGYVFRLRSATGDPYDVISFVVQYFFIVVAPVFFSAALYTLLTRLIGVVGEEYRPLGLERRAIWIVFVGCDVVTTVVQVAGAASIGSAESNGRSPEVANDILLAGLAVQVFTFLLFLVLFGVFVHGARKVIGSAMGGSGVLGEGRSGAVSRKSLWPFIVALAVATSLVYLRTVFRLAETAEGVFGYASSHEVFFGVLEFAPIVAAVAILVNWHPGVYGLGRRMGRST